jgi:hypothetical protein
VHPCRHRRGHSRRPRVRRELAGGDSPAVHACARAQPCVERSLADALRGRGNLGRPLPSQQDGVRGTLGTPFDPSARRLQNFFVEWARIREIGPQSRHRDGEKQEFVVCADAWRRTTSTPVRVTQPARTRCSSSWSSCSSSSCSPVASVTTVEYGAHLSARAHASTSSASAGPRTRWTSPEAPTTRSVVPFARQHARARFSAPAP